MAQRVFNTLTNQKEALVPLRDRHVGMYVCGPTVYDMSHIGHGRVYTAFDTIARWLRASGYEVKYVRNYTDVDDKIIRRAQELGEDAYVVSERYIREFQADMEALNVRAADVEPKVTEHMPEIISIIETLIEKGVAYESAGDVYFAVKAFPTYGKLSRRNVDDLLAGARVEIGERKRDPLDFALWKTAKPGEPSWESPWGAGRPGWHIECSAMSAKYLGASFDIHGGGKDLVFPHHENEIAQSEAATGKQFVKYWLHAEFLNVEDKKMAKSVGNIYTLRELVDLGYHPSAIRYLLLSAPYRTQLNFTFDGLQAAAAALERLKNFRRRLEDVKLAEGGEGEGAEAARRMLEGFEAAMDDDLNTSSALAAIFNLVNETNPLIDAKRITCADRQSILEALGRVDSVLGVLAGDEDDEIPAEVATLVEERAAARKARDFARADALRDEIAALGYVVEDAPDGSKIHKK
jgi:cysteinyl-tRNA synthetase